MLRYKSNTQAVVIAAFVILLCLVCLTGATLALFTSDERGKIGIITTTGDIDVDIVDAESGVSLVGEVLNFQTTAKNPTPFFEPGAVFFTQGFKIENKGNILVNFKLSVGKDNVVDINGEPVDIELFNQAFEVWISKSPRSTASAEELKPFMGTLGTDEQSSKSDIYYLVVRMKETAGDEFQKQTYSGIGVTVYAVQGNADIEE